MACSTFDIQGKRAEVNKFLAGLDERDAALNKPLAIVDVVGEERQAKWKRHKEGLWIKSRPDTRTIDRIEDKPSNIRKTRLGRSASGTMSLLSHSQP